MNMIDPKVRKEIESLLLEVEASESVRILYACESGSRAWGFPSQDSDYDVRFIYHHPLDWYLSIDLEKTRDVIERPISGQIDLSGWDLRKTLKLIHKSNPPLLEWLRSPIIYLDPVGFRERFGVIADRYYSPKACAHHYLHMAQGNVHEHLLGETIPLKKYFYALRPLLAIRWIEDGRGQVPMEFEILVETMVTDSRLKSAIVKLLDRKVSGEELQCGPRIAEISDFIDQELARLGDTPDWDGAEPAGVEELNRFFQKEIGLK
jgi:predicted nucleotidyltransferase